MGKPHTRDLGDAILIAPITIPYDVSNEKVENTTLEVWIDDQGTLTGRSLKAPAPIGWSPP